MLDAFISLPPYIILADLAKRFKVAPKDLAREPGSGISFSNRQIIQRDQVCGSALGAACSPMMPLQGREFVHEKLNQVVFSFDTAATLARNRQKFASVQQVEVRHGLRHGSLLYLSLMNRSDRYGTYGSQQHSGPR
jgi:hypothetical protein